MAVSTEYLMRGELGKGRPLWVYFFVHFMARDLAEIAGQKKEEKKITAAFTSGCNNRSSTGPPGSRPREKREKGERTRDSVTSSEGGRRPSPRIKPLH
ncbi:hypothetical protein CEXT_654101 [Caerostris extrusa]|uniref:Uncharacterized protein n=1 Tax=Caerostris extrusa TaxID=172846 RepID=A0AAV4RWD9_CAEEX|nr:hypothetical protein CEXT_654101 [Caerostris extrusa]